MNVCVTIQTIVYPSLRSVSASRQFWWRSRKEIWMQLVAYGYHSKMYQRPGGRMCCMMVFWITNCIWGDILKILLCLWWNPDNFTYMAEVCVTVRTVSCCSKFFVFRQFLFGLTQTSWWDFRGPVLFFLAK